MANQATTTISCPSGNAYRVELSDDDILPFSFFSRHVELNAADSKDQIRVRLGLCVSQLVLTAERRFRDWIESEPGLNQQRPSLPEGKRIAEVDEFAYEVAHDLSHWSDLTDMVLDCRAVLSKRGYVSEATLKALEVKYKAHMDSRRKATGAPYVIIDRVNIPDDDLYAFANFDCAFDTVSRVPEHLADRIATYAMLRYKGVPMETLVTAFAEAVDELVRSGVLGKTH
jgi:hypothetical protein